MPGDVIKKWNGVQRRFLYGYDGCRAQQASDSVPMTVDRGGESYSFDIPYEEVDGEKLSGITYTFEPKTFNFFEAVGLSFKWIFLQMREIISVLGTFSSRTGGGERERHCGNGRNSGAIRELWL
jgi:regulator of sigma E protease